ncbi:MAG: flagellar basal body-associated FliL family protein [Betaproteobacteria bacterium]|nr:flagellar basal body-associated FliL family protein [Betaproteobacteria bacterium]
MSAATAKSETPAAPASGGKRRILLIVGGIAALAAGAGAGWFFAPRHAAEAGDAKQPAKTAPAKKVPTTFVPLELFTVNIADREHYLQIGLTYEVAGDDLVDAIKQKMPVLRSRILLLLSNKTFDDLSSAKGKETLAAELVKQAIEAAGLPGGVEAVHFSAFVIQ